MIHRDHLDDLICHLSDGDPVDWDAAVASARTPQEARTIEALRLLSKIRDANATHSADATAAPLPFRQWRHLRLIDRIGCGQHGQLYRAWDESLQMAVALKLLPEGAAPGTQSLLLSEARMLARVRHENVVRVYGADLDHGRVGYWMELVDGTDLDPSERRSPLAAVSAGIEVAHALVAIHAAGVVHGDVKPANILRTTAGRICLVDFSVAQAPADSDSARPWVSGTPYYMAPELLLRRITSSQADVYSLGVLVFHLATGDFPFTATGIDALRAAHTARGATPLVQTGPNLPPDLTAFLNECMSADPAQRPTSARAVERLQQLATALSAPPAAATPRRRSQRTRVLLGSTALAIVTGTFAWWVTRGRPAADRPEPTLAVAGFSRIGASNDSSLLRTFQDLVNTGIVEASPCRVLSPEYVEEAARRQRAAGAAAPTDPVLALARDVHAAFLLSGSLGEIDGKLALLWRLVDTRTGHSLGGSKIQRVNVTDLTDQLLADVVPLLEKQSGLRSPGVPVSVARITTSSAAAYRAYLAADAASAADNPAEAIQNLEAAVGLDSSFALAWFALSEQYPRDSQQERARAYADRAWAMRARLGAKDALRLQAHYEFLHGNDEASHQAYRSILERWPDDRSALRWIGEAYTTSWNSKEAIRIAERGLALYPDDEDFRAIYRHCARRDGNGRAVIADFRRSAARYPGDPEPACEIGDCYLAMGEPDSALLIYQGILKEHPRMFEAEIGVARCAFAQGQLQESIQLFERAVGRTDVSPRKRAWNRLGIGVLLRFAYISGGQFQHALTTWDEAYALHSPMGPQTELRIRSFRVWTLVDAGRPEEAMHLWRSCSRRQDLDMHDRWELEAWRTAALVAMDSLTQARESLERLRAGLTPSWPGVWDIRTNLLAAEIAIRAHDVPTALVALDTSRGPTEAVLTEFFIRRQALYARAFLQAQRYAEGADACRRVLRLYGSYAMGHYYLGLAEQGLGHPREAATAYAKAVELWSQADPGLREAADARQRMAEARMAVADGDDK